MIASVPALDLPIIGPSNNVPQDDPQMTRNMYAEKVSDDIFSLKPVPGSELSFALDYNGGGRNNIMVGDRYFAVRGGFLLEYDESGSTVLRGTLLSTYNKVAMIFNNPPSGDGQILIVDDSHGYVLELSDNTFVDGPAMAAAGFVGGGSQAAFCAGRAIAIIPDSAQYQFSALYDFTTWSGIDSGTATCLSLLDGTLKAVLSNGDICYFFSNSGFEVWQKGSANAESPNPLGLVLAQDKIGILAPNSAYYSQRYAYWLGGTLEGRGVYYRHSGGGMPVRISDHSTERNINALEGKEDAVTTSYQSLGHIFLILTFRQANRTFIYDAITGIWHERNRRDPPSGSLNALPYISIIVKDGDIIGLDYRNGDVWHISEDLDTDAGEPIIADRILSVIPIEADYPTFYQSMELMGQVGNVLAGQSIPNVMLRYSTDRGMTWSMEDWRPISSDSGYKTRVRWVGFGSHFGIAFWFRTTIKKGMSWRTARLRAQ